MIDLKILALLSPEGFDNRFYEVAGKTTTYKKAYEHVEEEHELYFGKRKYAGYDSYRVCRHLRIKKKRKTI